MSHNHRNDDLVSEDMVLPRTISTEANWSPQVTIFSVNPDEIQNRLKDLSIRNDELRAMAEKLPPPQSWFDDTDDPFATPTR